MLSNRTQTGTRASDVERVTTSPIEYNYTRQNQTSNRIRNKRNENKKLQLNKLRCYLMPRRGPSSVHGPGNRRC